MDNIKSEEVPRFPIWAMEFGANYPFEEAAPIKQNAKDLKKYKGQFGKKIEGHSLDELMECLPNYAQTDQKEFQFITSNFLKLAA